MKNIQYFILTLLLSVNVNSQEKNLSEGPFNQLIIRGATLVNGNGSPPVGPVDIVIENNIITVALNPNFENRGSEVLANIRCRSAARRYSFTLLFSRRQ